MADTLYIGKDPKSAIELIKKFNANPDNNSGIVTVPKIIRAGESVTVPAGRVAVLPNVQVDGTLNIEGEVFIPAGASFSKVVETEGNQDIDGIKTFIESPIVPTPINGNQAVNKEYVDSLKTIASGTATFNSTTNNINLTGIGVGVEIGDVIQISGAEDAKNNSEFTVEVITDNDNIIVNQAHANKGTTKNVANRSGDAGVTVKLLAKWYNAPLGLGQGWVNVVLGRDRNTNYLNLTGRTICVSISNLVAGANTYGYLEVDGNLVSSYRTLQNVLWNVGNSLGAQVPANSTYRAALESLSGLKWHELR